MKNIVFRTDSSIHIGTGHVIRCLTLADALKNKGANCYFICREHDGHLINYIKDKGHFISVLPKLTEQRGVFGNLYHSDWLGNTQEEDAKQTIDAITKLENQSILDKCVGTKIKLDWVVVDHYALDATWEKLLAPYTNKILVIDDLADRKHQCDVLLDQNLGKTIKNYQGLVPENNALLLGPQYALLQSQYAELHPRTPPRHGPIKNILIYFGGSDQYDLTGMAAQGCLNLCKQDIQVNVVIGNSYKFEKNLQQLSNVHNNIKLHKNLPSLAPLMLQADLAIGAGGSTSWERCCLGLPAIVVALADNQIPIAKELHRQDLIRYIGNVDDICIDKIQNELENIIKNEKDLEAWSQRCLSVTKGLGAETIASSMLINKNTPLKVRFATLNDEQTLLEWVNDPVTRKNSFNTSNITPEQHRDWFYKKLREPDTCKIYILETEDELPVGQVRFDWQKNKDAWRINYIVAPAVRGNGLASKVLENALQHLRVTELGALVFGDVKDFNLKSKKVFKSLSFDGNSVMGGVAICSDSNSWMNAYIPELILSLCESGYTCTWVHDASQLKSGELCFYLSYGKIVDKRTLNKYKHNLVVHGSNLPKGKGWSPLTWQVLHGDTKHPLTLIEADLKVDSGVIYDQSWFEFDGSELIEEMREVQGKESINLCLNFIKKYPEIIQNAKTQYGDESFYLKRKPQDSKLNMNSSLAEQFNLLRVVDNKKYPAYFEYNDKKYVLSINKVTD